MIARSPVGATPGAARDAATRCQIARLHEHPNAGAQGTALASRSIMSNPSSMPLIAIAPGGPSPVPGPEVPDPAQVPHRDPEPGTPQKDPQPELPREDPQHSVPEIDPQPELPRVDPPAFPLDPNDPQPQVEYLDGGAASV